MIYGHVNKIIPFSSVDGPGNRTAIFLQGCNFNCIYCHNPETINKCINCGACVTACPTSALRIENSEVLWNKDKCCECDNCIKTCANSSSPKILKMTSDDVMNEIMKYRIFVKGITLSGGECTLQEEFLVDLFKKAKENGLSCFIDSNGSKSFKDMAELTELCDAVMLDVKSWNKDIHNKYIQFDNDVVINNLKYLASLGKLYEVRTVIVPELFNNEETVRNVSQYLGEVNPNIRYKLIKFRALGVKDEIKGHPSPTDEYMNKLKKICEENGCNNILIV